MLGKKSSRQTPTRSARLSSSISRTVSTSRQRPATTKNHFTIRNRPVTKNHLIAKNRSIINAKKPRTSNRLRLEPKKLSAPDFSLLGIIATSCLCIAASLIAVATFDPARDAENAMSSIAADYYVEFLYPRTLGSHINDPAPILSKYTETGLPSVRLSHLLLYNDSSHASYASYFNNRYYKCNVGQSYFSFYPTAPYGPRDYTVKYSPSCKKLTQ